MFYSKIKGKWIFPNSFWGQNYPDTKPEEDITRKLQNNISYEYRCKTPQQNTAKIQQHIKEDPIQWSTRICAKNAKLV